MVHPTSAVVRRLPPPSLRGERVRRSREPVRSAPPISNARLAVVMLLVAEVMFFSGLIGAYLVFRVGSTAWPPPTLPRLPLAVTWANTLVLVASGITMIRARRAARRDDRAALLRDLAITAALGVIFLVVQGSEWTRLIHHGLTLSSGMYGATFYALIGTHAVHVAAAVGWLALVWIWARRGRVGAGREDAMDACTIYWLFVCVLWVALFALVYR
jgi:heme/copper-type cytochrome/quinol oxidase subunit 3